MSDNSEVQRLRQQMDEIRCDLNDDMHDFVASAKTLTDYRFYLKEYPWACMAAVAAVGYLVVPNRVRIISPDVETLTKLAKKNHLLVKSKPETTQEKSGTLGWALGLLTSALMRSAIGYASQNAGKILGRNQQSNNSAAPASQRPAGP